MLPLTHRGTSAHLRSRGIFVLACVDDDWYENLSSSLEVVFQGTIALRRKALYVWKLVPYGSTFCSISFYFVLFLWLLPAGHQVRPYAIEIPRCPGILGRLQHHLVPGPGRQAPEPARYHPSLDD